MMARITYSVGTPAINFWFSYSTYICTDLLLCLPGISSHLIPPFSSISGPGKYCFVVSHLNHHCILLLLFQIMCLWCFTGKLVGARTLEGLETSGAYTYMFEEYSLRLCLLSLFPENSYSTFLGFLPVLLRLFYWYHSCWYQKGLIGSLVLVYLSPFYCWTL